MENEFFLGRVDGLKIAAEIVAQLVREESFTPEKMRQSIENCIRYNQSLVIERRVSA